MRALRVGGHRVICPVCKRRYATCPVFHIVVCASCLRGVFIGYMTGKNAAYDEIYKKYDLKSKEV